MFQIVRRIHEVEHAICLCYVYRRIFRSTEQSQAVDREHHLCLFAMRSPSCAFTPMQSRFKAEASVQ